MYEHNAQSKKHFSPNNIKTFFVVLPIDMIVEAKAMISGDGNIMRNIK